MDGVSPVEQLAEAYHLDARWEMVQVAVAEAERHDQRWAGTTGKGYLDCGERWWCRWWWTQYESGQW
jgi:hypothetical protein